MTTTAPEPAKTNDSTVKLTIDGVEVMAEKGELLISAAQKAGIFIPRFCYHDRLKPVGMCRMCLVEIEGVRGLPPACTTPVVDGMVVNFKKDNVDKAQDGVLEFLLINHPLDCPVCDRGGECPLQDQTLSFGPGESRFIEEKRHWNKPIEISDHVLLDRERCIQCSRCTRFADDVAGDPLISFVNRGAHTEVNTFPGDEFASHFSGNIVQICPVGALTAKPYRFTSRPWDLKSNETTCTGCSIGCKSVSQTSRNEMVRFLGVDSEPINQGWLCDKGRYGFDYIDSENRVRSPYIRDAKSKREVSLQEAIEASAVAIENALENNGASSIAVLGGAHGTNEDAYSLAKLAKGVIGTHLVDSQMCNSLPADFVLSSNRARIADLDTAAAIVVVGTDLKESHPLLYLRMRRAAIEKNVPVINVHVTKPRINAIHIDLIPGNEKEALNGILNSLDEIEKSGRKGKIVVIAGDVNPAQERGSYLELVTALTAHKDVLLLPSISPSNIAGAYEMGLAPGLLPGRVADITLDQIPLWPTQPAIKGAYNSSDTLSILKDAEQGKIKVLILQGANPVAYCGDIELAKRALENIETIIALDGFENESSSYAHIFIPTTMANEKDGTVTNIEGRVQRVVQVVAAQGNVLDDWKVTTMIAERLGCVSDYETVDDVTNEIARVAPSFAHLTTNILVRARDGAIVPVDVNKDALVASGASLVDTPSWEPIQSRAHVDDDPVMELDREEHHPSANIHFAEMISNSFERASAHSHHLDQYALRLVFADSFHRDSTRSINSAALSPVVEERFSHGVRVHPKDVELFDVRDTNLLNVKTDLGTAQVRVIPDKSVMRGVAIASMSSTHPLRSIVTLDAGVTDLRVEGKSK